MHQVTTVNGKVLETQKTTFVKQLKLGKVTLLCHYQLSTGCTKAFADKPDSSQLTATLSNCEFVSIL